MWIAWSLATGLQALLMISGAAIIAPLSADGVSERLRQARFVRLFRGTSALMGVAFVIAVVTIFTVGCDRGETEGAC